MYVYVPLSQNITLRYQLRRPYDTLSFLTIHQQTANELAIITSWMYIRRLHGMHAVYLKFQAKALKQQKSKCLLIISVKYTR